MSRLKATSIDVILLISRRKQGVGYGIKEFYRIETPLALENSHITPQLTQYCVVCVVLMN